MTDLLPVPINASAPSLAVVAGAGVPRGNAGETGPPPEAAAPPFAVTLDAFLDAQTTPPPAPLSPPARQGLADSGKDVPVTLSGADDTAEDDTGAALALAPWLPVAASALDPAPTDHPAVSAQALAADAACAQPVPPGSRQSPDGHLLPFPGGSGSQSPAAGASQPGVALGRGSGGLMQMAQSPTMPTTPTLSPAVAPIEPGRDGDALSVAAKSVEPAVVIAAGGAPATDRAERTVPLARTLQLQIIQAGTPPRPAGQVFAAALAETPVWQARPMRALPRGDDATLAALSLTPAIGGDRPVVLPVADAAGASVDLTQDPGLQRMIDRIETLRDDADSRDTRIRLVPDALGAVDVAVRRDGEHLHVRFTAEHDATRALIAEAQPRLTELAAARGVRIAGTSIDTGAPGSDGGGAALPQPRAAPRRAATPATPATRASVADLSTDQRLA